jgi:alpha-mannosidase
MTAVKKAKDENALVVRFYESAGKDGEITLQLPAGAQSAVDTDLMEEPMGDAALHDCKVTLQTKPYEIKIIKVQFSSPPQMAATLKP